MIRVFVSWLVDVCAAVPRWLGIEPDDAPDPLVATRVADHPPGLIGRQPHADVERLCDVGAQRPAGSGRAPLHVDPVPHRGFCDTCGSSLPAVHPDPCCPKETP